MKRILLLITGLLLLALVSAPLNAAEAAGCPVGWGSLEKSVGGNVLSGPIVHVRAGVQPCFDRLVFDVDGPRPGVNVKYVSVVTQDPSGNPVNVPGGARLQIAVFSTTLNPPLPNVSGFPVFRSVRNAGSFENVTSFGLGVRARLPFRVFELDNPTRVVIDVARSWNA